MTPLETIHQKMKAACVRVGRDPGSVKLLAVSKLQPVEKILQLIAQGQKDFGENYPQELSGKMETLKDQKDLRWHLIGHLQRNKLKLVSGRCELIHSIDSLSLAQSLSRKAEEAGHLEKILLQVNVAGEASKEGFSAENLLELWPTISHLPALEIHGLMTMPPLQNEPEQNRHHFRETKNLLSKLKGGHPMNQLSMGTSHDFEVAIEEGSTMIRLGTVLFGERT